MLWSLAEAMSEVKTQFHSPPSSLPRGPIGDVINFVNLLAIFLKPIPSQHAEDSENRCAGIASSCAGAGDRTPEDFCGRPGTVGFFEST